MNIIQLFSLLDIKTDQILAFGAEDYVRIEKKINFEKKINPEIEANTGQNLIIALKNYKEELLFVASNHILFSFFTHDNHFSKKHFSDYKQTVSDEKMKEFIALFLAADLISFFSFKLSKGWLHDLEDLDLLLTLKRYFPEEIIYKMGSLLYSKLDFAISQLTASITNDFSNIEYIKYGTFYDLLSHFTTFELDRKIVVLLNLVSEHYTKRTDTIFFSSVLKSMASYKAYIEEISKLLIESREILMKPKKTHENKKTEENTKIDLVIKIMLAILFLMIVLYKLK
ncbi:hypothetical protein [Flavobacterium lipolyticum]|uniref:Uncharacterized protein n=1 Tax=Flavobacterium lipolyticum TaxID=2893754 RepID=A0ABS8M1Q0_9FLAO|nr:hypothetical protein [Flavobacterium sp. F-126]MCC9018740.1 hypothetical protein [Flavobacterium sp. F-126]